MTPSSVRPVLSLVLAVALVASAAPLPSFAAGPALLQGRVIGADGRSPMSGVVVNLFDPLSQATFASAPTDERGAFRASAPAGTYRIVAETPAGAYLASGAIEMREGKNAPLALTLRRDAADAEGGGSGGSSDPGNNNRLKPLARWLIVGGIGVAAILAVDAATSDEKSASGF